MENIEKVINLLHKRKVVRDEQFANEERKQITEYSNLMNTLQSIKGLYFCIKQKIVLIILELKFNVYYR